MSWSRKTEGSFSASGGLSGLPKTLCIMFKQNVREPGPPF